MERFFGHRQILFAGIIFLLILISGCLFNESRNETSPIKNSGPSLSPLKSLYERHQIKIDPIQSFQTNNAFEIIGPTTINITGITDFPVNSPLKLYIIEESLQQYVCRTVIVVTNNRSGQKSFAYTYDMKGNPPGDYRVLITDGIDYNGADIKFYISPGRTYYKSIQIESVGKVQIGRDLVVEGMTDMPLGSEIMIRSFISAHSCLPDSVPDKNGERSFCGGSCSNTGISKQAVQVIAGQGNNNLWNATIPTSDWCPGEYYQVDATALNWTNVTSASTLISV